MIVMRVIPFTVPTIESLRLPEVLAQVAESDRGLVLVTGVSGSGKSSTVAAMVHHINRTQHKHVVTIENPIEFLHRDLSCSITQREVGVDTESLTVGLRAALRQDPDVVVLGDISDADTIDTAIKGAETGHLLIASMPTPDVVTTIERILTTLPKEEREIGRMRLSEALRAIVSQQLLPLKDEKGRVAAVEILVATPAVRECLKHPARLPELRKHMAEGRNQLGTQTFDQHVAELVEAGLITAETSKAALSLGTGPVLAPRKSGKQAASA
jgi:twitching motility protein PilT